MAKTAAGRYDVMTGVKIRSLLLVNISTDRIVNLTMAIVSRRLQHARHFAGSHV